MGQAEGWMPTTGARQSLRRRAAAAVAWGLAVAAMSASPVGPAMAGGLALDWDVENGFRFFADPGAFAMHREAHAALSPSERETPILSAERRLAGGGERGWAAAIHGMTCGIAGERPAACAPLEDYVFPKRHRIRARLMGFDAPRTWPLDAQQVPRGDAGPRPAGGSDPLFLESIEALVGTDADRAAAAQTEETPPAGPIAPADVCEWSVTPLPATPSPEDGVPPASETTDTPAPTVALCGRTVLLDIPYPTGARVRVRAKGQVRLDADVRVTDLFVVGLGDSFASGEGNPDVPITFDDAKVGSYGTAPTGDPLDGYPMRAGDWSAVGDPPFLGAAAGWEDVACHRSLYGHQLRAALQLALEDRRRAVTFVGLACAGAEVTAGLFLPDPGNPWLPKPPVAQLSLAGQAQCGGIGAEDTRYTLAFTERGALPELEQVVLARCPRERARPIDILFLSAGGNDIGFSRLVANAVLANESTLKSLSGWMGRIHGPEQTRAQLPAIAPRFKTLNRALHNVLHIPWSEPSRVILTAYPPLALDQGARDVCPDGRAGMSVFPDFQLSRDKAAASEEVAEELARTMAAAATRHGWTFVTDHRPAFIGRGICAGAALLEAALADDVRLPRWDGQSWSPYPPSAFAPYASRRRWFRTPNDAYMTANFHAQPSLVQAALKLTQFTWFQLVLASTYSGAFHPTAEGQAAIADAAAARARAVLDTLGPAGRGVPPGVEPDEETAPNEPTGMIVE